MGVVKRWCFYLGSLASWMVVASVVTSAMSQAAMRVQPQSTPGQEWLFFALLASLLGLFAFVLTWGFYRLGAPRGTHYWIVLGSAVSPWLWLDSLQVQLLLMLAPPACVALLTGLRLQAIRRPVSSARAEPA